MSNKVQAKSVSVAKSLWLGGHDMLILTVIKQRSVYASVFNMRD